MPGEYVVLRAGHPTYLNLQLPTEVAELIQYDPREVANLHAPGRGIAFLARGPGVVRVVPTFRAGEFLPMETMHNRYLATAHLTEKMLLTLPEAVVSHLGLKVLSRAPRDTRYTDDSVLWFLPAPEYYEYRADERAARGWNGPQGGGLAHLYLARSLLPWPGELESIERRIDTEEWMPRLEMLERLRRARRPAPA
jgi:hypothetical protein